MIHMRPSVPTDIPRQQELWMLAFGDSQDYIDNFYRSYYRPERVLVLEEDGAVQAMTAWFDTALSMPDGNRWKAGYLYAVATHPDARGKGLAGALLKYADFYLKEEQHCQAVTTVPAEPSLHNFFGRNGFRECFRLLEGTLSPEEILLPPTNILRPASPEEYGQVREQLLADIPHIAYPVDALAYQAGCCALSGGGLFVGEAADGPVCLCAEGAGNGLVVVKEQLSQADGCRAVFPDLPRVAPAERWLIRRPRPKAESSANQDLGKFGMLKWLYPGLEARWDWTSTAYMGLGFD